MARTAIPVTDLAQNVFGAQPAGVAADPTNDHSLDPGSSPVEEIVVEVTHTAAAEKDLTVLAGDNPPAVAAGQGNVVEAFAAGDVTPVVKRVVLESGRFMQSDGLIHIDLEAAFAGTIRAFRVPRG